MTWELIIPGQVGKTLSEDLNHLKVLATHQVKPESDKILATIGLCNNEGITDYTLKLSKNGNLEWHEDRPEYWEGIKKSIDVHFFELTKRD